MPDVELKPGVEYRRISTGPLARPKVLWPSAVVFALGTVLCSWTAWQVGTWWSPFLPVPCALFLGVTLAGLFPRYFFGETN